MREQRIELSEFQGFGSAQQTLAELTDVERQRTHRRPPAREQHW